MPWERRSTPGRRVDRAPDLGGHVMTDHEWKDFARRHAERIPLDWPDPRGAFWRTFREALAEARVTPAEADEVSRSLFRRPPEFNTVVNHPGHFLARLSEVRRKAASDRPEPETEPDAHHSARQEAWDRLSADEQESRLRIMTSLYPGVARWRGFVLALCQEELVGGFHHDDAPAWWRQPPPDRRPPRGSARAERARSPLREPAPNVYETPGP